MTFSVSAGGAVQYGTLSLSLSLCTNRSPAAVAELSELVPALRQPGLGGFTLLLHGVQLCLQPLTLCAHTNTKTHTNVI